MRRTPIERMLARVTYAPGPMDTRCWICDLSGDNGYTSIRVEYRLVKAHRFSYEYFVGPVPEGLDLDHLCRNRACVNPDHLEPVTRRINLLRGENPAWVTHRTNICRRGHSMADALPHGKWRTCRTCANIRHAERYLRNRDELNARRRQSYRDHKVAA